MQQIPTNRTTLSFLGGRSSSSSGGSAQQAGLSLCFERGGLLLELEPASLEERGVVVRFERPAHHVDAHLMSHFYHLPADLLESAARTK